jgi:hypothetical protein
VIEVLIDCRRRSGGVPLGADAALRMGVTAPTDPYAVPPPTPFAGSCVRFLLGVHMVGEWVWASARDCRGRGNRGGNLGARCVKGWGKWGWAW